MIVLKASSQLLLSVCFDRWPPAAATPACKKDKERDNQIRMAFFLCRATKNIATADRHWAARRRVALQKLKYCEHEWIFQLCHEPPNSNKPCNSLSLRKLATQDAFLCGVLISLLWWFLSFLAQRRLAEVRIHINRGYYNHFLWPSLLTSTIHHSPRPFTAIISPH